MRVLEFLIALYIIKLSRAAVTDCGPRKLRPSYSLVSGVRNVFEGPSRIQNVYEHVSAFFILRKQIEFCVFSANFKMPKNRDSHADYCKVLIVTQLIVKCY